MMSFMGTGDDYFFLRQRKESLNLSQWEPLFIYLNRFPIVPILSVVLWPFHIKSNNAKQTALMNSKTQTPKMFIPFISTTCWINAIHRFINRTEGISNTCKLSWNHQTQHFFKYKMPGSIRPYLFQEILLLLLWFHFSGTVLIHMDCHPGRTSHPRALTSLTLQKCV